MFFFTSFLKKMRARSSKLHFQKSRKSTKKQSKSRYNLLCFLHYTLRKCERARIFCVWPQIGRCLEGLRKLYTNFRSCVCASGLAFPGSVKAFFLSFFFKFFYSFFLFFFFFITPPENASPLAKTPL